MATERTPPIMFYAHGSNFHQPSTPPPAYRTNTKPSLWDIDRSGQSFAFQNDSRGVQESLSPQKQRDTRYAANGPSEETFSNWAVKDFSRGAVSMRPRINEYKPGQPFAPGYMGARPLWRAEDGPLDGGKAAPVVDRMAFPGYGGFRPGESSVPFVDGNGQPKSMASRIAQRRLGRTDRR